MYRLLYLTLPALVACSTSDFASSDKAKPAGASKQVSGTASEAKKDDDDDKDTAAEKAKAAKEAANARTFYAPISAATTLPASFGIKIASCKPKDAPDVVCDAEARTITAPKATVITVVVTGPDGAPTTRTVAFYDPASPPTDAAYVQQKEEETAAAATPGGPGPGPASPGGDPVATTTSDTVAALAKNNADLVSVSGWVQSTPEATHQVGGLPCPAGTAPIASVADCSGSNGVTCFGNLVFCAVAAKITNDPNQLVTLDIAMTPEGTHQVGGVPCAAGYAQFGGFPDCNVSNCYGNQLICARQVPLSAVKPGDNVVTAFSITPENAHVVGGPPCPAGQTAIGSTADCGLAHGTGHDCFGNQLFCVAKAPLK